MSPSQVVGLVLCGVGFLVVVWLVVTHNRLVQLRSAVRESWADVDSELRRRYDLIPNLVDTVKAYAAHERAVFEAVTTAREAAIAARSAPGAQAQAENELTRRLGALLAVAENYPALKAGQNFLALQRELANTEDRIQAARRFYNANVRDNNNLVQSMPSGMIARAFGFVQAEFFRLDDPAAARPVRADLG